MNPFGLTDEQIELLKEAGETLGVPQGLMVEEWEALAKLVILGKIRIWRGDDGRFRHSLIH